MVLSVCLVIVFLSFFCARCGPTQFYANCGHHAGSRCGTSVAYCIHHSTPPTTRLIRSHVLRLCTSRFFQGSTLNGSHVPRLCTSRFYKRSTFTVLFVLCCFVSRFVLPSVALGVVLMALGVVLVVLVVAFRPGKKTDNTS